MNVTHTHLKVEPISEQICPDCIRGNLKTHRKNDFFNPKRNVTTKNTPYKKTLNPCEPSMFKHLTRIYTSHLNETKKKYL